MAKKSVPENLGWFGRIPVYRGAGLGRFHCTYLCRTFTKQNVDGCCMFN